METPHYYADGYKVYGNWPGITFTGIYKNTSHLPYRLHADRKQCKTVALFIMGIYRGETIRDKCQFKFSMYYDHSVN
jgi:hypothetical protein